jgi:hypothetical protein
VRATVLVDVSSRVTKALWRAAADRMSDVPNDEHESLPADGASQVDHGTRGTPKRSA